MRSCLMEFADSWRLQTLKYDRGRMSERNVRYGSGGKTILWTIKANETFYKSKQPTAELFLMTVRLSNDRYSFRNDPFPSRRTRARL